MCLCWGTHVQGGQRVPCRDWVFSSSSGSPGDGRDSSGEACQASFPPGPSHLSNFVLFNFKHLKPLDLHFISKFLFIFNIFLLIQFALSQFCACVYGMLFALVPSLIPATALTPHKSSSPFMHVAWFRDPLFKSPHSQACGSCFPVRF